MEKAIAKIKRLNSGDKDLFVQVIDKSWFKEDDTIKDIQEKIKYKMLGDLIPDWYISWITTSIVGNCVVAIGYIWED